MKTNLIAGTVSVLLLSAGISKADQVSCLIDDVLGGGNATAFHCQGYDPQDFYGVQNSGTNQGYITTIKLRGEEYLMHQLNPFNTPAPVTTILDANQTSSPVTPCLADSAFVPAPLNGSCRGFAGIK